MITNDAYMRTSIYDPGRQIVLGWDNIMPTFKGQVSPEEVNQLIASLSRCIEGDAPVRRGLSAAGRHSSY